MVQVRELAQTALDGRLDVLEAACAMAPLLAVTSVELPSQLVSRVAAIASELDDMPIGAVAREWEPNALAEKRRSIDRYRVQVEALLRRTFAGLIVAIDSASS
jgi:hypothetical protein